MTEIDVEPVDSVEDDAVDGSRDEPPAETLDEETTLPTDIDAPEYVLYGGKGGVGKTTCAAATALASAADGTRTLVVSTDPAHSLSDTLGVDIPAHPSRLREDVPLWGVEIDPDAAMEEGFFAAQQEEGPVGDLAGMLGGEGAGMESLLGGTMPGADEAAAMQKLIEHMDDPRFDRVVVDTAPTGHTLRLLQLPEMLDTMVGRMVKLRQQFSGMMDGIKGVFGGGADEEGAGSQDLDELKERIERLRTLLRDPNRTDFRVVMVPETMSVVESERLVSRLEEFDIPVGTLVVNRVMEDPADVADLAGSDERSSSASETESGGIADDWVVTPNLEDCEFCQRRWSVQQDALSRATDLYRGREVKRVPLLADDVRGEAALRVVAACLD
ncbi:ArsA family ATPase [Halolamina salifodinae]|uniref:Arsenite-transporting ATPase n=1 Tax=Halolamina salifodinae TaxID=1202767 RepID=A0A8T4GWW7_9EURY|nr:TRC40/GET3/ArsA family transport-energizing ATPase [Halolamina salifodinae]MBP1985788.1 arsenite-transporting ATPase [Halolamina salifodinae]